MCPESWRTNWSVVYDSGATLFLLCDQGIIFQIVWRQILTSIEKERCEDVSRPAILSTSERFQLIIAGIIYPNLPVFFVWNHQSLTWALRVSFPMCSEALASPSRLPVCSFRDVCRQPGSKAVFEGIQFLYVLGETEQSNDLCWGRADRSKLVVEKPSKLICCPVRNLDVGTLLALGGSKERRELYLPRSLCNIS